LGKHCANEVSGRGLSELRAGTASYEMREVRSRHPSRWTDSAVVLRPSADHRTDKGHPVHPDMQHEARSRTKPNLIITSGTVPCHADPNGRTTSPCGPVLFPVVHGHAPDVWAARPQDDVGTGLLSRVLYERTMASAGMRGNRPAQQWSTYSLSGAQSRKGCPFLRAGVLPDR